MTSGTASEGTLSSASDASSSTGGDTSSGPMLPAGTCAPSDPIERKSAPGAECSRGDAQTGGLCHDLVELALPEEIPDATALADLDGDGLLDIVIVGSGWVGSVLSVAGAWPQPLATSSLPVYQGPAAAGDLDEDGAVDLIVGRSPVTLFRGSGDGGFSGRIGSPVPAPLVDAFALDTNGDGFDDLVTLHADGSISTLASLGGGRLATRYVRSQGCAAPLSGIGADFDGDGTVDLAIGTDDNVTLFLGDGAGGFTPETGWDEIGTPVAMAADDFDGDGVPELAVVDASQGRVVVLDLIGGEPTTAATIVLDATPSAIRTADLQDDGSIDIVVAYSDAALVTWIWGQGDGSFATPGSADASIETLHLDVVDMDGDGFPDAEASDEDGTVIRMLGGPSGEFGAADIGFAHAQYLDTTRADLDGDGRAERVSLSPTQFGVSAGLAGGEFGAPVFTTLPDAHDDLRFVLRARLNDDAMDDILVAGDSITTAALLGTSAGTLGTDSGSAGAHAEDGSIAVADFDADDRPDFVMNALGNIRVWESDGAGSLEAGAVVAGLDVIPNINVVGRVDADANDDVLWVTFTDVDASVHVAPGNGDGTFGTPITSALAFDAGSPLLGDVDEDGVLDLVTSSDHVMLSLGNGDGTFAESQLVWTDHNRQMLADFNDDGHLDIAAFDWFADAVGIALGDGNGNFAPAESYPSGGALNIFPLTGDLNGDGLADALLRTEGQTLRLLMSNPCGCGE